MEVIYLLLLIGATLCFAVSAFAASRPAHSVNDPRPASRVNLITLGLMLWVLVAVIKLLVDLV